MPIRAEIRETLTPRERAELDWEKESARMQIDYAEKVQAMELEIKKLETKWTQLFRIPEALLRLPIKLILSLAIPISVITKHDLPEKFWEYLK